jgi:imidazolonepropionase-like amidohydrolase
MTIDSATRGFVAILALGHSTQVQGQRTLPPREHLAIVHATIYTMTDSVPIRDGSVVIDGGHLVAVGPARSVTIPAGARVIDATGKFVIPGLWDMHAHNLGSRRRGTAPALHRQRCHGGSRHGR